MTPVLTGQALGSSLAMLSRLPLGALYGLAFMLYWALYRVVRYRRDVVRENLRGAFPDMEHAALAEVERRYYRFLADMLVESVKASSLSEAELARRVRIRNPEVIERLHREGQSVIVMATHQGNNEWLLLACRTQLPFPVYAVYKPLHSPAVDRFLRRVHSRFGVQPVSVKDAVATVLQDRERPKAIALVADQTPLRREAKHWTRFLGRDTPFYLGSVKLARITGYPVVFAGMRRVGRGRYEVEFQLIGEPPYGEDAERRLLDRYAAESERRVRAQPESWLWSHRRWKYKRPLYGT